MSDLDEHDRGLSHDLQHPRHRRAFLGMVGAGAATVGGAVLLGTTSGARADAVDEIPTETAGPFPGDGSNGPDALGEAGIVRRNIRRSFGTSTTRAPGQRLEFKLKLKDTADLTPLVGYAVYAWHCDRAGAYSMYSAGVTGENYLRGVQVTNRRGGVRFKSIYPGCYPGRWPHIHFEVYPDLASITEATNAIATSQIAMPEDVCDVVFAQSGYERSVGNLSQVTLATDNVFGDDSGVHQVATVTGDVTGGYHVSLEVPVDTTTTPTGGGAPAGGGGPGGRPGG
jgi:protocatechuate 3,4-dioxygenase beta subunit